MSKDKKTCRIEIRITEKEKKRLDKIIKKSGMTQSDFLRDQIFGEKMDMQFSMQRYARVLAEAAELVRYLGIDYADICDLDEDLNERMERVWKALE